MTEQLGEPTKPKEAATITRYEDEIIPERFAHLLRVAGSELASRTFQNETEAREAGRDFSMAWLEKSESLDGLRSMMLRAEGDGMYITNASYEEDENGDVLIRCSQEPILVPLGLMSTRRFQFRGLSAQIGRNIATDEFSAFPYIVGNDIIAARKTRDMRLQFPLTSISYQTTVMVPCVTDIEIESVHLRQERRRVSAMQNLAEYAVHYPDIINDLTQIDQEMHAAKGRGNELRHVNALRELGMIGVKFSSLSVKHEDALNTAIVTTIGEGRPLSINGNVYSLDAANDLTLHVASAFKGALVNVIANTPTLDEKKGQTLALTPMTSQASKGTYYAPLSEIKSVRF